MPAPTAGGSENEGGGDNGSSSDIPEVADLGAFHPDQLETLADIQEELERLEAGGNVEVGDVVTMASMDDDVVDHEVTIIAEQEGEGISILPDMEDQETILTEEVLTLPDSAFNVDDGLGVSEQIVSETMEIPPSPSDDMESVQVSTVETYVPISSVQSAVNSVASLVPVSSAESLIIEEPVPTIIEQTVLTESIQMQPHTAQIQTSVPNMKQLKPIVAASKKSIPTGGSTKNVIAKVLFTNTQGQSGQPVLLGTEGGQTIRILNACNVSNNKIISSSPKTITLAQAKQMGLLTPGKLQQILPTNQKNVLMNKVMVDPKKTVTVVKSPAHSRKTVTVVKSPAKILPLPTTSQLQSIAPLPSMSGATTPQKVLIRQGSTLKSGILTSGTPGQIIRIPNSQNISSGSIHQIQMPGKPVQYVQFVGTGSNSVTSTTGPITIVSSDSSKLTQGKFVPVNAVPVSATTKKPIPVALTTNLTSIPQQFKVVPIAPAQTIPQQTSAHTRVLVNAALPSDAGAVPSVVQAASLNNIVMVPAQYVQQLKTTESSAAIQTASTDSITTISSKLKEPISGDQSPPRSTKPVPLEQPNGIRPRKPCNCTKSQCLKLYCDCFANGEFCYQCNCNSCFNNLDHEEDRQRAIKSCLERNPNAFRPKIGKSYVGDGERRHNKGCNCKRSGCLKNYCECYEAKIPCSNNCKCVGCRNVENDLKELAQVAEERVLQANTVKNKFSAEIQDIAFRPHNSSTIQAPRQPFNLMTQEVIQATCQCLLAQVEIQESLPTESRQRLILEEFGRCLVQIINCATKTPMSGPT